METFPGEPGGGGMSRPEASVGPRHQEREYIIRVILRNVDNILSFRENKLFPFCHVQDKIIFDFPPKKEFPNMGGHHLKMGLPRGFRRGKYNCLVEICFPVSPIMAGESSKGKGVMEIAAVSISEEAEIATRKEDISAAPVASYSRMPSRNASSKYDFVKVIFLASLLFFLLREGSKNEIEVDVKLSLWI